MPLTLSDQDLALVADLQTMTGEPDPVAVVRSALQREIESLRRSALAVSIVIATEQDLAEWAELRVALWPEGDAIHHRAAITEALKRPADFVAFLARDEGGKAVGLAEASLRHDYVNGCETSPVLFLEGIYVAEAFRCSGIGRRLSAAVADWGREAGCREFASDAPVTNTDSHRFHASLGFVETEQVVYFRQLLDGEAGTSAR